MEFTMEEMREQVEKKIEECVSLIKFTEGKIDLEGMFRLKVKIEQELRFLNKIKNSRSLKADHVQCSNLKHFDAVVESLRMLNNVVAVYKPFYVEGRENKLFVDIVAELGLKWVKVIARNPKSLSDAIHGNTSYKVRNLLEQAEEFMDYAKQNPCLFETPKVMFWFTFGIEKDVMIRLLETGIEVYGNCLENGVEVGRTGTLMSGITSKNSKVNVDISTMIAYTSSITNSDLSQYKDPTNFPRHMVEQAKAEAHTPVKKILDDYFLDKRLFCSHMAYEKFMEIVNNVAGPGEKQRAKLFMKQIAILPDQSVMDKVRRHYSDRKLKIAGKIKERSLQIFAFGDRINATTVTANEGFVRSAKQRGVNFVVFLHGSRALTEMKEIKALSQE